jgi:hypothetical protein
MEQTAQVTITGVSPESKQGEWGAYTLYRIGTAQGFELVTWSDPLGQQAQQLQGQTVTVAYEIRQNPRRDGGVFTDYRLKSIQGGNVYSQQQMPAQPPQAPQFQPQPPQAPSPPAPAPPPQATAPLPPQRMDAERELRIMRQSALDRAIAAAQADIVQVPTIWELVLLADTFVTYFEGGREAMATSIRNWMPREQEPPQPTGAYERDPWAGLQTQP